MSHLYFLNDFLISNYLDSPNSYKYLLGKYSAVGYTYWILYNKGYSNIKYVDSLKGVPKGSYVFFHYDDRHLIDLSKFKGIQLVSDRPPVEGCVLYFGCNKSLFNPVFNKQIVKELGIPTFNRYWVSNKWFYAPYPFTFGMKKCKPSFPPKVLAFSGREYTQIKGIASKQFKTFTNSLGLELRFYYDRDNNKGDEDIWFCVRDNAFVTSLLSSNNIDGYWGNKHAGRLYQAWYMGVPSIFESNTAMLSEKKDKLDFLEANSLEELMDCLNSLCKDPVLYVNMVKRSLDNCGRGGYVELIDCLSLGLKSINYRFLRDF